MISKVDFYSSGKKSDMQVIVCYYIIQHKIYTGVHEKAVSGRCVSPSVTQGGRRQYSSIDVMGWMYIVMAMNSN